MIVTGSNALGPAAWFTSSYSNDQGADCVEGARLTGRAMAVRDSKDRQGPAFVFPEGAWTGFLTAVKAGAFDGAADAR
ncbi:DUF397 domain-containing protein [Streptomyces litchfieldiae]|uniref:DUF397 domain-containing protein n=1 Tax=Streptomyces litchfieldiae TaxID=3075543 RepID=A0ABU2MMF6_9ACTN|nr:DUF397 domain-containing protein [Streptomyces sp. DSM 44938]MDT0342786.1 DUF397 domain-containing protein [Streptomyces sp. DSM 44938]